MDESMKTMLVVGGTVLLAVLVHLLVLKIVPSRARKSSSLFRDVSVIFRTAKSPWLQEEAQMDELARLVKQLSPQGKDQVQGGTDPPDDEKPIQ